ncbi:MAG: hypothetical protein QOE70_957 [Chthoniobacter sp.]|nr:hypothetical protein [Chthoniobacter sp.]
MKSGTGKITAVHCATYVILLRIASDHGCTLIGRILPTNYKLRPGDSVSWSTKILTWQPQCSPTKLLQFPIRPRRVARDGAPGAGVAWPVQVGCYGQRLLARIQLMAE